MTLLGISIIIVCIFAIFRKRSTRKQDEVEKAFWQREYNANHSPRQDISGLPYITIPLNDFPIGICKNEEIKCCEDTLISLSGKKILNLGSQTNTDLKLSYGVSNLTNLMEYDENFSILCQTLIAYAEHLTRLDHPADARKVLEFGISCGSDFSRIYLLLAELCLEAGDIERLRALITQAALLDSPQKAAIERQLREMLPS